MAYALTILSSGYVFDFAEGMYQKTLPIPYYYILLDGVSLLGLSLAFIHKDTSLSYCGYQRLV